MFQKLITRKNLITISLAVFYSMILLFVGACLDAKSGVISSKNPIAGLGRAFGFKPIDAGTSAFLFLVLVDFYILLMICAICYERRYAIVNGIKTFAPKMIGVYVGTFFACAVLSIGFGFLLQKPWSAENIGLTFSFLGQSLVIATLLYVLLFIAIGSVVMLVVNFIFVDKPYRFFDSDKAPVLADEIEADLDVKSSFDVKSDGEGENQTGGAGGKGGNGGNGGGEGGSGDMVVKDTENLADREKVFPELSRIDVEYEGFVKEKLEKTDTPTLDALCEGFRNYLTKEEKLYFDIDVIRFFISGFAASHFQILEGLSGTGKSSLPRYFAKYVNGSVLFMPVQATWRDKTNLVGFFNEFSKTYSETEFLSSLYRANYNPDMINIFVLDEMNISRVEYYFADLLSVLEYPVAEWKLKVMQLPFGFVPPIKLEEGYVRIPENSYFVGTANKDDSTFTITDKVYDRAITMDFTENNKPFEVEAQTPTINLSHSTLRSLYTKALSDPELLLTDTDRTRLNKVLAYAYEAFDVAIGNRILNQIENIVPVFVAAGGKKETAIDLMISKKLISKLEGRFEDHIKDSLEGLVSLLEKTYGHGVMKRSVRTASFIIKNL